MSNLGTVSKQEWRRVILFAGLVMLFTTIPYLVGWLSQGDHWEFGGFVFGVDDGHSYLAKMRLGARGDWLFTIRYTSEPHDGALLFLPYLLLGKLTALLVDPSSPSFTTALAITFHLARIVFGVLMILISYRFVAVFLRSSGSRMLALVLITLGGGLGWLLSLVGLDNWFHSLPVDFFIPEGYSFLILFGLPHLALSRGVFLLGFLLLFQSIQTPGSPRRWLRWSLLAGLCWVVMGLCVPFYIAVLYLILGFWGLAAWIQKRSFPWGLFWRAASAGLVVLPLLLYNTVVFTANAVFHQWSAQNQLPSPHPLHYVLGYIVLAVPAAGALRWAWHKSASENKLPYLLLASWVVIVPVLVYLPINVQRRLAEGVIVPLSILVVAGLRLMIPRRQKWKLARRVLLILVLPTSALLWLGGLFNALTPQRPVFQPVDELHAMDALNAYAPRDAVVLCSKETGNYLPARTDLIAYVGHGPETLHGDQKEEQVKQFFAGTLDPESRRSLLNTVNFVFYGPLEHPASPPLQDWTAGLRLLDGLSPSASYVIYEVPRD